jgi:nucleoside-diphosphate-sugar epimerase
MARRIFVAGATGAIGQRLLPLLRDAGDAVMGITRSAERAAALRASGVEAAVVDVYDADGLAHAMAAFRPEVVIHQLTDLPKDMNPREMPAAIARNARVREEGTRKLVAAALACGARRMVAESIAWVYAPGSEPHAESDPMETPAAGDAGVTLHGVIALERAVLDSPPLEGMVLRYGRLYGPGTHSATPAADSPVHVDAAAYAAFLAIDCGEPGIYNVAEPTGALAIDKARTALGWRADFRLAAGAAAPI